MRLEAFTDRDAARSGGGRASSPALQIEQLVKRYPTGTEAIVATITWVVAAVLVGLPLAEPLILVTTALAALNHRMFDRGTQLRS